MEETPLIYNDKEKMEGSNGNKLDESPFRRSSVIRRSPPANVVDVDTSCSQKIRSDNFERLGAKITQLVEFLRTCKNVHKEIHIIAREMQALFIQVPNGSCSSTVNSQRTSLKSKETQTETWLKPQVPVTPASSSVFNCQKSLLECKGTKPQAPQTPETSAVKRGAKTQSPKGNEGKKKKDVSSKMTVNMETKIAEEPTNKKDGKFDTDKMGSDWIKVVPKAKKRMRQTRPDALIIKTCGDTSYADILRQVKRDPKLNVLGENIKNIRKTEKGELLLELNKSAHENTNKFREAIVGAIGSVADVRALTHEVLLEIRDIDEVTTKEEVFEALIGESEEFNMSHWQKSTGD